MTIEQVQAFISREQQASRDQARLLAMMADDALVAQGDALTGLTVAATSKGEVVLKCDRNESRFRPGSKLEFRSPTCRWTGTLVELHDEGTRLVVRTEKKGDGISGGPFVAVEPDVDFSAIFRQCLRKLQPGAPGIFHFRLLAGTASMKSKPQQNHDSVIDKALTDGGITLDSSQRVAVARCLQLPAFTGVQGPPGTGKSTTLAVVAECLARMGQRVVVLAPTHQAVNNALSGVHRSFPKRHVVKVGDELRRESLDDAIPCQLLNDAVKSVSLTSDMIVGMTFLSALNRLALRTSGLGPNVVLIDEAGQLPLVQGLLAGLIGAGSVLLFGDDAQMPPVFPSEVADDPLATSLFSHLRKVAPESIVMLDTTYRMNAGLCSVIATHFYSGAGSMLRPSDSAAAQRLPLDLPADVDATIAQVLTPETSAVWVKTPNSDCRQINNEEACFVGGVVATLLSAGLPADRVAVVTPFRRQAAAIRRRLQGLLPALMTLPIVDTVERVQGLTVDVICISFAVSDADFAGSLGSFLFSPNRLNVAISRARMKAIIAMSPSVFTAVPSQYDGYRGLLRYRKLLESLPTVAPVAAAVPGRTIPLV